MSGKITLNINVSKAAEQYLEDLEAAFTRGDALLERLEAAGAGGGETQTAKDDDDDDLGVPSQNKKKTTKKKTATRGRPKKEETFGDGEEDDGLGVPTAPKKEVTAEECMQALIAYKQANGKKASSKVMAKFGAATFNDVDPKNYASIVAMVTE